jgi:hypothetical protein
LYVYEYKSPELKQKANEIKSFLEKKIELTFKERGRNLTYAFTHIFNDFFNAYSDTVYMSKTLGRGNKSEGIPYIIRAKKNFKSDLKTIHQHIDLISETNNPEEKYDLILSISKIDCDLYNLQTIIRKLTYSYNNPLSHKSLLKLMSQKPEFYSHPFNLDVVLLY